MIPLDHVIGLSAILFMLGAVGVLVRRNLVVVLMSIELMLNASNLVFVAMNRLWPGDVVAAALNGQIFALMVLTVATAEVVIGVGIVLALLANRDSADPGEAKLLRW